MITDSEASGRLSFGYSPAFPNDGQTHKHKSIFVVVIGAAILLAPNSGSEPVKTGPEIPVQAPCAKWSLMCKARRRISNSLRLVLFSVYFLLNISHCVHLEA
jgi:hypothetical protein